MGKQVIQRLKNKVPGSRECGIAFIETLAALAILGSVTVAFLSGLTIVSRTSIIADEQTTAESIAQSQLEFVKDSAYVPEASTYSLSPLPGGKDYTNYSATITAQPLNNPDGGIQKITVTVTVPEHK